MAKPEHRVAEVQSPQAYGFMGGTFSPIHFAHLRVATEFSEAFSLSGVSLMPCAEPVHRELPDVTTEQRITMLNLAVQDSENLSIDLREINRSGLSYTVESLREIRAELGGEASIYFAMGSDAFNHIQSWHLYEEIFQLSNIVVMHRPDIILEINDESLSSLLQSFDGLHQPFGALYELNVSALDISSSEIRKKIKSDKSIEFLLPKPVEQYIDQHQLYQ